MTELVLPQAKSLANGSWSDARAAWEHVFAKVPRASPFVSPLWTQVWTQVYGPSVRPQVLLFRNQLDEPIGACLLSRRTRRAALIPHVRAHLNTDGEPDGDSVIIEHNALLSVPGEEASVLAGLARHVERNRIDEFVVSGMDEVGAMRIAEGFPGWTPDIEWRVAPYVDLELLRVNGGEHLKSLSRNSREQLKRSMNKYELRGPLTLEVAKTADAAIEMLGELVQLHELHWQSRGEGGGFRSELRRKFHAAYIRAAVPVGAAQLIRVSAGGQTIGVIYTLVANGLVNFYQSGLRYEEDKHLKPGMVTHHLAIQHCLEAGMAEYDFLVSGPDEGRYKTSLSNSSRRLAWLNLARPGWRRSYFNTMRAMRRKFIQRVSQQASEPTPQLAAQ